MNDFNVDLEHALEWAAEYHSEVETKFIEGLKDIPSFGPEIDPQLQEYILGLANWPRCNDCWNFESGRYFGNKGLEIQKTRRITLLPKRDRNPLCKQDEVEVPLVEM